MMFVCPECQFENPTDHKYCQRCGTSLTLRDCPECGAEIPWATLNCPSCGAAIANVGLLVIHGAVTAPSLPLDPEGRYSPVTEQWATFEQGVQGYVWDQRPLQKTYLEQLLDARSEPSPAPEETMEDMSSTVGFWFQLGVVPTAIPYLVLQESLAPTIPVVQDTWRHAEQEMVLLEDRAEWDALTAAWADEAIPLAQLLYWLNEMLRLWTPLQELHCARSLLQLDNLCLDEDQILCLRKLHRDSEEINHPLTDLGKIWRQLFSETNRTLYGPLAELLGRLDTDEFVTVEALREELQAIARQNDPDAPALMEGELNVPTKLPETSATLQADAEKMIFKGAADDLPTVVLPMQLLSLSDSGHTDIGKLRDHNEDHFGIDTMIRRMENAMSSQVEANGVYIVCDGMGGHAAGEVASAMAVESLQLYFRTHWQDRTQLPDEMMIRDAILTTNQKIYEVNMRNSRSGSGRMGTTLVMVLVQDINIAIAHVGDSRVYRVTRKHGLEQLTVDHEVGQREIARGVDPQDAYARPDAYQLTQALGPRDDDAVNPDIQYLELSEDTILFLCSDGISDEEFLENHYQEYLTPLISSRADLSKGMIELIEAANEHNGHDNLTGLVVRVKMRPNADHMG